MLPSVSYDRKGDKNAKWLSVCNIMEMMSIFNFVMDYITYKFPTPFNIMYFILYFCMFLGPNYTYKIPKINVCVFKITDSILKICTTPCFRMIALDGFWLVKEIWNRGIQQRSLFWISLVIFWKLIHSFIKITTALLGASKGEIILKQT